MGEYQSDTSSSCTIKEEFLACGSQPDQVIPSRSTSPAMDPGVSSPPRPSSYRSAAVHIQDQGDAPPPWRAITQKTPPLPVPDELAQEMSFRVPSPDVSQISLQSNATCRFQQSHIKLPGFDLLASDKHHSTPTKLRKGRDGYCEDYPKDVRVQEYPRYNSLVSERSHMVCSRDDVTSDLGSTLSSGSQDSRRPDYTTTLGSNSSLSCYHSDGGDYSRTFEAPRNSPTSYRSCNSPEEECLDADSTIISEYNDHGREPRPPCVGGDAMMWRMGPVGMPGGLVGDRWRHHEDGGIQGSMVIGMNVPDYSDIYGSECNESALLDPQNLVSGPRVPSVPEISMFPSVGSDSEYSQSPSPVRLRGGVVNARSASNPEMHAITTALERQQLMVHYSPVPVKGRPPARHHRGHRDDMMQHEPPGYPSRQQRLDMYDYDSQDTLQRRRRRQSVQAFPQKLTQQTLKHHTEAMGPVIPQHNVRQALRRYHDAMEDTSQYPCEEPPPQLREMYEKRGQGSDVQLYVTGVPSVSQVYDVYRQQMHYETSHPPVRQAHPGKYLQAKSACSSHVYQSLGSIYETIPECHELGQFRPPKKVSSHKRYSVHASHYQSAQDVAMARQAAGPPSCSCSSRYGDHDVTGFTRASELRASHSRPRRAHPEPAYCTLPRNRKNSFVLDNDMVYSNHRDLAGGREVSMMEPSELFLQRSQVQGPRYGKHDRALNETADSDATAFLQKPLVKQHALTRNDANRRSIMKKIQNFGRKMTGRSSGKSSIKTLAVV